MSRSTQHFHPVILALILHGAFLPAARAGKEFRLVPDPAVPSMSSDPDWETTFTLPG